MVEISITRVQSNEKQYVGGKEHRIVSEGGERKGGEKVTFKSICSTFKFYFSPV